MKKIFNLTTFSFLGPFVATFFTVLFTLLIQFLWKYIDDMVGKGLEWYVILQLLFYASASFVPLALPLSILLSSIMAFGKLSETYELVALKSAGISLLRIMWPLIILVIIFSIGAFFFANNTIPSANLKFRSLLWDIRQQRPALDIQEGVFYGGIDNYSIRINKKDKNDSKKIEGIKIYDHTRGRGNDIIMTADRGEMLHSEDKRWLILKLFDGTRYEEMESKNPQRPTFPLNRLNFASYELKFDLSAFKLTRSNEDLFKDHYEMLNVNQLNFYEDSLGKILDRSRNDVFEFTKPYFQYQKDTSYFLKAADKPQTMPVDNNKISTRTILDTLPAAKRKPLINNTLVMARQVKTMLEDQATNIENYRKLVARYKIEWHRKFALSLACLTLFFIGAPLGAIIRKGGLGMPTVVSIFMFLIFYVLSIVGEKSAKQGAIEAYIGMWIPTMTLLPIGFILTYQANRDAISFSMDRIIAPFRKLFSRFRNRHAPPPTE
jgi:lipopolysaccharide export system permease protein